MLIDIFLLIILFTWLIFASISDLKTREVPNWLNYSLIIIALITKLIHSIITKEFTILYYSLMGFSIFFIISLILYYTKQWGGGDAKLLMGIGAIIPTYPNFLLNYLNPNLSLNFLLILFVNILIVGAVYGLIWSLALSIINFKKVKSEIKKVKVNLIYKIIYATMFILILYLMFITKEVLIVLLLILIIILPIIFYLIKATEKVCMFKTIPIEKLTEGDWITEDIIINNKKVYSSKSPGIELHQIKELLKSEIKKVTIKEGIPFIPSFLVAIIITLIFGNLFFFL